MAAKQLDELWDNQVSILSRSYQKTLDLLSAGQQKEAYDEYHGTFVQAVKKIYSEAPQTYPQRFSKIDDWCSWIRVLYVNTMKADKALAAGNAEQAKELITGIRGSFFTLHQETGTQQASDFAYALKLEAAKSQPSASDVKTLRGKLDEAKLPNGTQADAYAKARGEFTGTVDPLLVDDKLEGEELPKLRSAADALYESVGEYLE